MKPSMRSLLFLILICATLFAICAILVEWILTNRSILELAWKNGFKVGGVIGGCVGAVVWLMYRFNIR